MKNINIEDRLLATHIANNKSFEAAYLCGVGFHLIGTMVEKIVGVRHRHSGKQQGEQHQRQGKEYMSFHLIFKIFQFLW